MGRAANCRKTRNAIKRHVQEFRQAWAYISSGSATVWRSTILGLITEECDGGIVLGGQEKKEVTLSLLPNFECFSAVLLALMASRKLLLNGYCGTTCRHECTCVAAIFCRSGQTEFMQLRTLSLDHRQVTDLELEGFIPGVLNSNTQWGNISDLDKVTS